MRKTYQSPRVWTRDELAEHRARSERLFTTLRKEEGPRSFEAMYLRLRPRVEAILEATSDLVQLDGDLFREDPEAWQACRYVCGPPISQEDLWTLVGGSKFKRVPADLADSAAEALVPVVDPVRFPWVATLGSPTPEERERAIMATSLLWAAQQLGTERRGEASTQQERLTGEALESAGYSLDPLRTRIEILDELSRGMYSQERKVAASKCDVPVRLRDGRLLALECKVSNGPKNGWKRVNREVGGKAETWRQHFGQQVVTGIVVAGVFDLSCLMTAQEQGIAIFWQHDLGTLTEFAESAEP